MTQNILIPQPHIKGLIFDLDGTLADTMPLHIDSWIEVGQSMGVEVTAQMINERAGIPTLEIVLDLNRVYGWTIDPAEFRKRKNVVYTRIKKAAGKVQPIPEILEIARANRGVRPMGVGTGSIRKNATAALSDLDITDWFVYEDSPVGIKAALDGGMHAVNITTLEYFSPRD